jgi:hypothetical protein
MRVHKLFWVPARLLFGTAKSAPRRSVGYFAGTAEITTKATAIGLSSAMVRSICAS